jgi:hypothetical protein
VIAGVVSYILLCWGGGDFCGIGYSDILILRTPCSRREVCLPPGFCYVCVCVGLAHLVFCGRENKCVKCRIYYYLWCVPLFLCI